MHLTNPSNQSQSLSKKPSWRLPPSYLSKKHHNPFVQLKNDSLSSYYRQDGLIGAGSFGKAGKFFKVTHKATGKQKV